MFLFALLHLAVPVLSHNYHYIKHGFYEYYIETQILANYWQAEKYCSTAEASLFNVDSLDKHQFVLNTLQKRDRPSTLPLWLFIRLKRSYRRLFQRIEGTSLEDESLWRHDQPSDSRRSGNGCVVIDISAEQLPLLSNGSFTTLLRKSRCDEKLHFVCLRRFHRHHKHRPRRYQKPSKTPKNTTGTFNTSEATTGNDDKESSSMGFGIAIVIALLLIILSIVALYFLWKRKKHTKKAKKNKRVVDIHSSATSEFIATAGSALSRFTDYPPDYSGEFQVK